MKRRILGLLVVLALLLALPFGAAAEDTGTSKKDVTVTITSASWEYDDDITFQVVDVDGNKVTSGNVILYRNGFPNFTGTFPVQDGVAVFDGIPKTLVDTGNAALGTATEFKCYYDGDNNGQWNTSNPQEVSITINPTTLSSVVLTSSGYAYGAPTSGFSVASADAHVTPRDVSIYESETGVKDTAFGEKAYEVHLQLTTDMGYSLAPDAVVTLDGKTGKPVGDGYYVFQLDELCPTYTITYNLDGGTLSNEPSSYNKHSGTVTIPNPTKDGYKFLGWTGEGMTEPQKDVSFEAKEMNRNLTYTANWEQIVYYDVEFITKHGTAPQAQQVESGTTATEPVDPKEDGWKFKSWHRNNDYLDDPFDFNTPITGNTTLYAKWVETFTVTFDTNGHGTAPAAQTVEKDGKASKPENPTAKGWRFDGWYTDEACTAAYDFEKKVTENITLYAKWTQLYTLTFETNGGTKIDSVEAPDGSLVYLGSYKPTKSGYYFVGWYTDKNLTQASRVSYVRMDGNKTVYAKFAVADKTNPKTADPALPGLALAVLSFSTVGLAALGIKKRK